MSSQQTSGPVGVASLPDVNAQTYPFDVVIQALDRAADFDIFLAPDNKRPLVPDPSEPFSATGGFRINVADGLHHFETGIQMYGGGVHATRSVGGSAGRLTGSWMVCMDNCPWTPGVDPNPPVLLDPTRSQPLALVNLNFAFADGHDSFQGYGQGRTFPTPIDGHSELQLGGMGNVTGGTGKFHGLSGTFVFTGKLTADFNFLGNVTARFLDWDGVLRSDSPISPGDSVGDPDPDATYIVLRGMKKDQNVKSEYIFGPSGMPTGLLTPAEFRSVDYTFTRRHTGRGLRTGRTVGSVVAKYSVGARITADLLSPPGTPDAPQPFTTREVYIFANPDGETVGTLTAGVVLGKSFNLTFPMLPGQPGLRFAGFGPIEGGTGVFEGAKGMLTVNSLIGISPHALALMHVIRIIGPAHKLRR